MPEFDDLILSVTARLTHEIDLAFSKNNGELANHLRSKFKPSEDSAVSITEVALDEDGDIRLRIGKSTWYFSATSVTAVGWLTSAKAIREGEGLDGLSDTMERLFAERNEFQPQSYDARLLIYSRGTPDDEVDAALLQSCGAALAGILSPETTTPRLSRGRVLVEYQRGSFVDSLDFEASKGNVELRYGRAGLAKDFTTYGDFLRSAKLNELVDEIRPFAETFRKRTAMKRPGA